MHSENNETSILVVITDHSRKPNIVDDTRTQLREEAIPVRVSWFSWDELLERLNELDVDQLQPQHEPLVGQLERALTDEGYGKQFSELIDFDDDTIERFTKQQDQLIGLVQDLDRLAPEIGLERYSLGRAELHHWGGSKSLSSLSKSYNPLAPEDIMVSFVPEGFSDYLEERSTSSAFPGVHLHLLGSAVEVGIHLRPNKNEGHRQALLESSEYFISLVREHDLTLFSMWNSWGISNEHTDPDEIEEILTDNGLSADDGYKQLLFGWRVEYQKDGADFVKKILDHLEFAFHISWVENRELFHPGYSEE